MMSKPTKVLDYLNYHVAIYYDLPITSISKEEIVKSIHVRLQKMNIELGKGIVDPLVTQCLSVKKTGVKGIWSGSFKIHLLKPESDGLMLLKGIRPFILKIDGVYIIGKVHKSFLPIAKNTNLSVKIKSKGLVGISPQTLFGEVLDASFRCGKEFEVTGVHKGHLDAYVYIVATTPPKPRRW